MCRLILMLLFLPAFAFAETEAAQSPPPLRLAWEKNYLTISGDQIPGKQIKIHYLEAYCRAGSTTTDWTEHTVVGHKTDLVRAADNGTAVELRCRVNDGIVVDHKISATHDEVTFEITAHNPTEKRSESHWAQPCIRLDKFTGCNQQSYLAKSFVFVNNVLTRMPFEPWATEARYTPGQVWRPKRVPADDVNPRPLSRVHPSNGLIGCFSKDESKLFAVAFDPWQELFQGVIVCLHSDFRLGGLKPNETKKIRGKIYLLGNDVNGLLRRYQQDFGDHKKAK